MQSEVRLMRSKKSIKMARLLAGPLVLVLVAAILGGSTGIVTAAHTAWPASGMICTTNDTASFSLVTMEGTINMPDGNTIYMWGYSEAGKPFQHPSPVLCVNEGDTVTIVLHNTLPEDVSIVFPGQNNVLANSVPSQPVFSPIGNLTSLAPVAKANGGSVTYSFVAEKPGTYLYYSGTEAVKQVNMGLFGALVVRPAAHPDWAYNETAVGELGETYTTQFEPTTEYVLLLSEIDPNLHMAVEQDLPYNMNNYRSRYWLINGRSFPDTIAPNGAEWLPNQPYSSLLHIHPYNDDPASPAYNPYPALVRFLSVGSEDYPHHPHGNHGRIIARDGNVLIGEGGEDLSYEKFTVVVGPGETHDELFAWTDVEQWDPVTNPIPVEIPQLQNLVFGTFYSGSPYLGNLDTLPVGHQALNQCGEYYHIAHNHSLQQITAWGVVLSGHITFTRIDPPLPNDCP
jgi:FtsP/CotA-like multicopper oxidase with cupredoxin domain